MAGSGSAAPDGLFGRYTTVALVVGGYWIISISMVFINKHLLSGADFDAPMFVTWFQCLISVLLCWLCAKLAQFRPNTFTFPEVTYDTAIALKILPLSLIFVGMIALNNLCLKYITVQFYNVARSLSTVFNILCTYLVLGQSISLPTIGCCAIIISGFILGIDQEHGSNVSFNFLGIFFGVAASLFVALNAIMTKKVFAAVDNNVWRLALYNNANALVIFIPVILVFNEVEEIFASPAVGSIFFWCSMVLAGVCGFSIGAISALQIQVTSPLTHNVSGTAKAAAQTVIAVWWWSDHKSLLWWFSNFLVLGGSGAYTRVKQLEMIAQHAQEQQMPHVKDADVPLVAKA